MLNQVKTRIKKVQRWSAFEEYFEVMRFYGVDNNGVEVDYFSCPVCNSRVDIQHEPPDSFHADCLQNCKKCNTEFSILL